MGGPGGPWRWRYGRPGNGQSRLAAQAAVEGLKISSVISLTAGERRAKAEERHGYRERFGDRFYAGGSLGAEFKITVKRGKKSEKIPVKIPPVWRRVQR